MEDKKLVSKFEKFLEKYKGPSLTEEQIDVLKKYVSGGKNDFSFSLKFANRRDYSYLKEIIIVFYSFNNIDLTDVFNPMVFVHLINKGLLKPEVVNEMPKYFMDRFLLSLKHFNGERRKELFDFISKVKNTDFWKRATSLLKKDPLMYVGYFFPYLKKEHNDDLRKEMRGETSEFKITQELLKDHDFKKELKNLLPLFDMIDWVDRKWLTFVKVSIL